MTNPILIPQIVQKIFNHLDIDHVYECRMVCQTWYREAIHSLTIRPRFDVYYYSTQVLTQSKFRPPIKRDQQGLPTVKYGTISAYLSLLRPSSNQRKCNNSSKLEDSYCFPKFSGPRIEENPTTAMDVAKALMNVLGGELRRMPKVSLVFHTGGINRAVIRMLDNSSPIISIEVDSLVGFPRFSNSYDTFCVCHIKQLIPDHKIIVTDWSNPASIRPELDDPNFPVKTLIYFCQSQKHQDSHMCFEIRKFIENSNLNGSGACFFFSKSFTPISLFTKNENERIAMGISIAFLGKDIQSASLQLDDESTDMIREKLLEFKQHLTFCTDDERVLAFWFIDRGILGRFKTGDLAYYPHVLKEIKETFPQVTIVPVMDSFDFGMRKDVRQILHFIRI